jgi:glycosyltransferase involved in cell wall biosynthesis
MRFSVVIPYYNHARYLEFLIKSLERQQNWIEDIIIVDDGSPDCLYEALKGVESPVVERIKTFRQANSGTAIALNNGIKRTACEHVAVLNSDDAFSEGKFERCASIFQANEAALVFGSVCFIDGENRVIDGQPDVAWYQCGLDATTRYRNFTNALIHENVAATSSNFVFKRSLFDKIGGFRNYRYANDLDFLLRANAIQSVHFDRNHTHVLYRYHGANTIKEDVDATTREVQRIVKDSVFDSLMESDKEEFEIACAARGLTFE